MTIPRGEDPIAALADAAIAHMNADHADAVLAYARSLANLSWAERATIQRINAAWIELHAAGNGQTQVAQIPFAAPLTDPAQLRPALVALAAQAQIVVAEPAFVTSPPPDRQEHTARQLFNAISTRRSFGLKAITPEPIDRNLVEQILEAANWAPSHGKTEPWRFVVYSGDARRIIGDAFGTAFGQLNPGTRPSAAGAIAQRERVWGAPVWIALGMQPDPQKPEWEELIAFGNAVQNAQLMASALGLASKWTSGATATHQHVAEAVGFSPDTRLYGFLYIGHPAVDWPAGRRRPLGAKVRWIDTTHENGSL